MFALESDLIEREHEVLALHFGWCDNRHLASEGWALTDLEAIRL